MSRTDIAATCWLPELYLCNVAIDQASFRLQGTSCAG